jgi:hypothetical protein
MLHGSEWETEGGRTDASDQSISGQDEQEVGYGFKLYRKKPVVIQAFQFDTANIGPALALGNEVQVYIPFEDGEPYLTIPTLEGEMRANHGDWIIRGVQGELYPCKDEIFRQTYEPA